METRANYVRVGIFTLVILGLAFAFVYWAVFASRGDTRVRLLVRISGSVTGLQQGSQVLFNGLPVGTVGSLRIDPNNPGVVIATTQVDPDVPIKESTQANIGFAGLTGQAFIELKGGAAEEPDLIDQALAQGAVPVITANPSDVTDILATARDISERANNILSEFQGIVDNIGPSVRTTAQNIAKTSDNVQVFTAGLAANSDNIDTFLASLSRLADTANSVAAGLPDAISQVRNILAAVDPGSVSSIVGNIEASSASLKTQIDNIGGVLDNVRTAANSIGEVGDVIHENTGAVDTFLKNLAPLSDTATRVATRLDTTLETTDQIVKAVDPAKISSTVDSLSTAANDVSSLTTSLGTQKEAINSAISNAANAAQNVNRITTTVAQRSEEIDTLLANLGPITDNVRAASSKLNGTLDSANQLVASIDSSSINQSVTNVRDITSALNAKTNEIQSIIDGVDETVRTLDTTLEGFSETRAQIDTLIASVDPGKVNKAVENISSATDNVAQAADSIRGVADSVGARRNDINDIISNADEISKRLNAASARVNDLVNSVNSVLAGAGDGTGLGVDLATALRSVRSAAQTLQEQIVPISGNLQRFSSQGLQQVQGLISNVNRTVDTIDNAVSSFARNPSQIIYGGGDQVKQYDGRSRR